MKIKERGIILFFMFIFYSCSSPSEISEKQDYEQIKSVLQSGWNTFNTFNSLWYVHMPEGFEIAFDFKYQGHNFSGYLPRANFIEGTDWSTPKLKARAQSWDGSYTRIEIDWEHVNAVLETATQGDDFVALVTPAGEQQLPTRVIVRTGIIFNREGTLERAEESGIVGRFAGREIRLYPATDLDIDFATPVSTPYLAMSLSEAAAVSTGRRRTLDEVRQIIDGQRAAHEARAAQFGPGRAEVYEAITTILAWNTIYEPVKDRVLSTVSRTWNENRGGYGLFCWDNFFMAYLCAIDNKELAFANVIEHLNDMTEEGFVPNNSQGNGRMSWDRSQPPVGGIMTREIYKQYPEKWFLEATFDRLLTWNRWWMTRRYHEGMLCWGSHQSINPFNDRAHNNHLAAVLESGLDDSPMYDGVPFDAELGILLLHDVGLNSLYVADCEALAEMAREIGREKEAQEMTERADMIREQLKKLWNEEKGIFMNRRTDTGAFVEKHSPTLFYALMARAATPEQAERMVMREYPNLIQARKDLSEKSLSLFVNEWNRMGYISENYSAFDGTGDDPRINSHPFYSWGALLGIISFIEEGMMPAPDINLSGY